MAADNITWGATLFSCTLGLAALLGGLYLILRSRVLERRCTGVAQGVVVDIRDESFGKGSRGASAKREAEEAPVIAANEAIAAKKRAYNARRRIEAEAQAQAAASTWRPIVRYEVAGEAFEVRATRGVSKGRFKVGQPCEVHYDPARPAFHWLQVDGLPGSFGTVICLCGAALVIIGVICWFMLPAIANLAGA